MPTYQLLTDRTLAQSSAITPTTLIHIVTTGDTTQNPAGSSYKAELGQLAGLFSGTSDTLVTGGTYSAGTITFTNNSGSTFSVSGLTEPFSGGSGNCITDLYVTNIHGCSPITIYDSIRSTGSTVSGLTSFSFGFETSATTDYSFAINEQTLASGQGSHAEGLVTIASGLYSHAEGVNTIASNVASHSEGLNSLASGYGSHAEGGGTNSIGFYSHAEGASTITNSDYSHAEGHGTVTDGLYQHAQGTWNATGDTTQGAFIIGNGTNNLNRSNLIFAAGNQVNISGKTTTTNFQMTSGATNGYVLTSDVSGNASWQTPTGGGTFTGGTVSGETYFTNGLTANTMSASTLFVNGIEITGDTYVTGITFNTGNYDLTIGRNDGVTFTDSLSVLSSDLTITGGTYNSLTGVGTFTNNTGGTFNVTGFLVGYADTLVTGSTYNNNTFTFTNSTGGTFNVLFNTVTGLTSTGLITSNTISATTYQNLPLPAFVNFGTASTINWNVSGGSNNYKATLTASTTLNVTNVRDGEYGTIVLTQDSVGSRTITLGTINGTSGSGRHKVSSGGGGSIYLTSNPNAIDIVSFVYDGNILYWTVGNDYT